ILITGGCGYIGSHIVKLLSEAGEQVIVYDNLSQGHKSALLHNEELVV
ncbi:UDP-glucose 4-epimerase GalE, partial [Candidatus Shapirobacteria bacterium CG10_big_fil_rev_8_21_14_0_10_36_6]